MPPVKRSIASRQKAALDVGFIDLLGEEQTNFNEIKLDSVVDTLLYLAAVYKDISAQKLNQKDKVSSGFLADSIQISDVKILGRLYTVNISLAKYYKFVDEGVDGWANPRGSKYKFKHYTGKSGKKSSEMVTAVRKWIIREGLQASAKLRPITSREKKQSKITDTSTRAAIIISRSIRKFGIEPTHFWSETEQEVENMAKEQFASAIKVDIINILTGRQ